MGVGLSLFRVGLGCLFGTGLKSFKLVCGLYIFSSCMLMFMDVCGSFRFGNLERSISVWWTFLFRVRSGLLGCLGLD